MATMDYVDIPSCATRLESSKPSSDIRPATKIITGLPNPEKTPNGLSTPGLPPMSPSKIGLNFQQMLLSSALPSVVPSSPRVSGGNVPKLLSTKDPLSIPITTVNFRRFVSKSGPVFWVQDRFEEIFMWRKGWKYTSVWMAAYAFLCYFPRLVIVVPFVALLGILLAADPSWKQSSSTEKASETSSSSVPSPPPAQPSEGSVDWMANLQAIQNLMGAVSDLSDLSFTVVPHLNYTSPYTPIVLTSTLAITIILIPIVNFLPMRFTVLLLGLAPFVFTHPFIRNSVLPAALYSSQPYIKRLRSRITRYIDNDRLEDKHWNSEMREVELWENERWLAKPPSGGLDESALYNAGWSKANLKVGERRPWTKGRDGWSAIAEDGTGDVSSNLTFSLAPGWLFVETEDWRPDLEGAWISNVGADEGGWVYTNDTWMQPHASPREDWKAANGMTRRRRWIRRIYYQLPPRT